MDSAYDRKFEEMKKYIPFLENMIKRLESTSSGVANPRQAQLDKIKSLRDLLQDKKKRMKMENLLKCEQVLVNLYAKVEQKDSLPEKPATKQKQDKDLESVRNKLKSVSTNLVDNKDTLPEIARASEVEEVCTPGSKEPALFQRRPNLMSTSPARNVPQSSNAAPAQSSATRNYTRVLVSPEPRPTRWESPESTTEKPLFSRRSPRRSPKGVSPAYHKKERRKSKSKSTKKAKDLNITLNVPEESLESLNTTDILTRIMKCNDNDVDIETLREAKRQILSELNQTGANCDDISDLLLKSYKDSKKTKPLNKKAAEIEEGELSDSESEAIESIYGDVLIDSKGKKSSSSKAKKSDEKEQPRKIQICLVINSDKDSKPPEVTKADEMTQKLNIVDVSDFQMYDQNDANSSDLKTKLSNLESSNAAENKNDKSDTKPEEALDEKNEPEQKEAAPKPANFYKPMDHDSTSHEKDASLKDESKKIDVAPTAMPPSKNTENAPIAATTSLDDSEVKKEESVEIPLLNEPTVVNQEPKKDKVDAKNLVSEIDILQALKNEILGESIPISGSETVTPALHQPKITKVASAQEIAPKKRISFEKYKEKVVPTTKATTPLFVKESTQSKEDQAKKQSLKLTMKECERFNFPTKLALEEDAVSDDDETDKQVTIDSVYENIAPKSPDQNEFVQVGNAHPVIIPVDSVKGPTVTSTGDVDMRTLIPPVFKNVAPIAPPFSSPVSNPSERQNDNRPKSFDKAKIPSDPRLRRDMNQSVNPESSPFHPGPLVNFFPNMTPSRAPNMTPNMNPNMTPSRTPIMTPNARSYDMSSMQSFDAEDNPGQKHVYAPMFTPLDREKESSVAREIRPNYTAEVDSSRPSRWEPNKEHHPSRRLEDHDSRSTSMQKEAQDYQNSRYSDSFNNYNKFKKKSRFSVDRRGESYSRAECPLTPVHPFGRSDCPSTPTPSFGRQEAPMTPLPSFGRDCPPTPSYQFGRSECPLTPSHPFGRSEAPVTPSHPFGRSECPLTPSHPFGRVDMPLTPSHPFGRSDNAARDPRLNRSNDDYKRNDRDHNSYYKDRNSMIYNPRKDKNYGGPETYKQYREQNMARNDRFNKYSNDTDSRHNNREQQRPRREPGVGRGAPREHDEDHYYTRDRGYGRKGYDNHGDSDNSRSNSEFGGRKGFYCERSIGRSGLEERPYHGPRATSVGRSYEKEENNRLSVKPDAGRAFTIDTSVTTTFQDFLDTGKKMQVFDYSFDGRRKRASSVGRSLCRESSVGRTLPQKPQQSIESFEVFRRNDFRRAASVGRDLAGPKSEKSFTDIKAEFQMFKTKIDAFKPQIVENNTHVGKEGKKSSYVPPNQRPSRKDLNEIKSKQIPESNTKKPYSPRKNYRDPRMRKEVHDNRNTDKFNDHNRKNAGIVYSNDNITKGTIMGSGYGVKNYKIPKIKRPVEELEEKIPDKVETDKTEPAKKSSENFDVLKKSVKGESKKGLGGKFAKSDTITDAKAQKKEPERKNSIEKNTYTEKSKTVKTEDNKSSKSRKQNEDLDKKAKENKSEPEIQYHSEDSLETVEKRVTRSARKSTSSPVNAKSRNKKAVIYDTDSDEEQVLEKTKKTVTSPAKTKSNKCVTETSKPGNNLENNSNSADLDASFGIDDLEMFNENMVSDPVIDNINALIADLDNDLGNNKTVTRTDFSSDLSLETMLETITSQGKEVNKTPNEEESLNIISEVINNDLDQSSSNFTSQESSKNAEAKQTENVEKAVHEANAKLNQSSDLKSTNVDDSKCEQSPVQKSPSKAKPIQANNDDMVSTSDTDNVQQPELQDKRNEHMDVDGSSTPDSTINTELTENKPSQIESAPDSTNEVQNESNSTVSSTHDNTEFSNKDTNPAIDSIGNILSLLQNKSKIKELLSLLGEQSSDNDKIKKKLEKLSEIVSDDDDDPRDGNADNGDTNKTNDSNDKSSTVAQSEVPIKDFDSSTKPQEDTKKDVLEDDKLKDIEKVSIEKSEENDASDLEKPPVEPNDLAVEKVESKKVAKIPKTVAEQTLKALPETNKEDILKEGETSDAEAGLENNSEEVTDKASPAKRGRRPKKRGGKLKAVKNVATKAKRVTRSSKEPAKKLRKNELLKLQEDIKEMFMRDEVLNATGIRMCRLAKMADDRKEDSAVIEPTPVVVVEKVKDIEARAELQTEAKSGKIKQNPKTTPKPSLVEIERKPNKVKPSKYKPGPKSKTKHLKKHDDDDDDPYAFESDSVSDMMNDDVSISTRSNDGKDDSSSESEDESLASSRSVASSELLSEVKKKPKRKRSGWRTGVIKRSKKKKTDAKQTEPKPIEAKPIEDKHPDISLNDDTLITKKPVRTTPVTIPDLNCFTDKLYCFRKDVDEYPCRLCKYVGPDIVHHYKQNHPHSEIPLSRMNPETARDAIEQCDEINFQVVSKIPTDKYVCRFCFKEFGKKKSAVLESFFWHVVSMHTGEYKKLCSECINITRCPFNLDIPPPPKDAKGQLIGYICEKCNFTQISLENLKTHVIVRHNDEQTEVYTINLAVMSKKMINSLLKRYNATATSESEPRVLRSLRSNQSMEASDDRSDATDSDHTNEPIANRIKRTKKLPSVTDDSPSSSTYHSKITFENDENISDNASNGGDSVSTVKVEREELEDELLNPDPTQDNQETYPTVTPLDEPPQHAPSDDIFAYPHFKISYTDAGLKEYVCCINGVENHYKTTLLISMKKHVQIKHQELWDGYCFVCKVIVTPQGQHSFKDCFQHYLDTHMDNFPVLEKPVPVEEPTPPAEVVTPPKPKIHVRPLSELICTDSDSVDTTDEIPVLPKIERIVSLSAPPEELNEPEGPVFEPPPVTVPEIPFKYEEAQAEVMSKKQQVVLSTMMTKEKLINVYKCAGRYCSFTTDFIEDALQHASKHQTIGGDNAMTCAYCNFDCAGNTIDLVMHVFKSHGACPYACGHCFYRAAASLLVTAHSSKVHRDLKAVVLRSTVVPPPAPKDTSMLTREQAVQYYICGHAPCKFRTYTAKKFFEHLLQTHPSEFNRPCYLCPETASSPAELVQHMKVHDINVYQCTWCVRGADSEPALLAHGAAAHPAKQPQAYLRVITKKDGSDEYRVLPLASFNKSKVAVDEVPPSGNKDNPVREAERSIELEKLIGHTNQMIESMATMTPVEQTAPQPAPVETPNTQAVITKITPPQASPVEPRQQTPPPTALEEERSQMKTPVLKTEPQDSVTPSKDSSGVIYCLDSDEDDDQNPAQSVVNLSDEETTPPGSSKQTQKPITQPEKKSHSVKVNPAELLKCPNCFFSFKSVAGFKKHTNACFMKFQGPLVCAHCPKEVEDREALIIHYSHHDPTLNNSMSTCAVCSETFPIIAEAKRHMRVIHKIFKMVVTSNKLDDNSFVYTIRPNTIDKDKVPPKRKLSGSNPVEPPAKKRYGPLDVHQLPINPILDELVYCSECEFSTKVRLNMVRHLQLHAQQQPAPNTAPVNPVPHLETNEMHFDKMVNLASSSIVTRTPDKTNTPNVTVTSQISAEEASRYPKFVAERQRYACGAQDCSYMSLDEAMFQRHWQTLHSGEMQFTCVHCARNLTKNLPWQFQATVMEHYKMHDANLYGCSMCLFCHFDKEEVRKHAVSVHKTAKVIVIREEVEQSRVEPQAASRMDLKLWQCGLCPFRSLLRAAIITHCGQKHQSKMQYKCGHCPFRASSLENVQKHQGNSHPGRGEEVFYYFYQDGTLPDEPDGVPKWQKQRQKAGVTDTESEVKTELEDATLAQLLTSPVKPVTPPVPAVDLNIVKQELTETFPDDDESLEALCQKYGQFCEPNGLSYKCPLCSVVEETLENMQSHLFEELKYRRFACAKCPYRAYHGAGLDAHVASEHRGRRLPPRSLPRDLPLEKWVAALLQHQTTAIATNKENLAKQKILTERPPKPTTPVVTTSPEEPKPKPTMTELEKAFGPFGQPTNMSYCCPKCPYMVKVEADMRDHLEAELTKIRWHCSHCTVTFQTYHEAQFHCKSVHARQAARPREAARDPGLRAAWLAAALQVQKLSMKSLPITHAPVPEPPAPEPEAVPAPDNSLLVVRYEEDVTVAEEPPRNPPAVTPAARKRSAPSTDSDDERLVIDEPEPPAGPAPVAPGAAPAAPAGPGVAKKRTGGPGGKCPYCNMQTKYTQALRDHICNIHFGIKPYQCTICKFHDFRKQVKAHVIAMHRQCEPNAVIIPTPLPARPAIVKAAPLKKGEAAPAASTAPTSTAATEVCLSCQAVLSPSALELHRREHPDHVIVSKGEVIVKCCLCIALFRDVTALKDHHSRSHAESSMDYAHFRILKDERDIRVCGYCSKRSVNANEMTSHHASAHASLPVKYRDEPQLTFVSSSSQDEAAGLKRKIDEPSTSASLPKKVARKSTTKLPFQAVAKKSTTKLPFYAEESELEYSYYGTKPAPIDKYDNVTTLMPFCNTMVPFTMKKLSDIIKIDPKVIVKDVREHPSEK